MLAECLDSLASQTLRDFEVIVVDNGSEDGSVEFLSQSAARVPYSLRLIENRENRGFCAANNQGIAVARGSLIALLNNDAAAHPEWLAELAAVMDAPDGRDIGMVASKILVHGEHGRIDKAGHLIFWDGQNRGRGTGEADHGQFDQVEEVAWPDGCAALYRKAMLDQIGGFDEDFFAYADDAELGLRARIAGWGCLYNPRAVVYHRRGQTLGMGSRKRLELIERNRLLLVLKLFPPGLVLLNPLFYAARLAAGALASLGNRGDTRHYPGWAGRWTMLRALAAGDLAALAMARRMLNKRKEIKRFRKLSHREVWALLKRFQIPLWTLAGRG